MLTLAVSPLHPDRAVVARAAAILRQGGLIAFPTDTLYGLAVDPHNERAVARLFDIKGRSPAMAIPLIASSLEQAETVGIFGDTERRLARTFWPGPLSIAVPARAGLPAALLGGGRTVAVRVPAHRVARELAEELGCCVTATSANESGRQPHASPHGVASELGDRIDVLLDGGIAPGGPPSTIVQVGSEGPRLLRPGAIAWNRVLESLK